MIAGGVVGTATDVDSARLVARRRSSILGSQGWKSRNCNVQKLGLSLPRTRADMRTLAHQSVVCEVPTRFVISAYSNRVMVVVTQADNMGTLVSAAAQAPARPAAADV